MSLALGISHFFSREAQSGPACRETNLLQMKMAFLFLSRSHLNGSMSLEIICCVHSLFWAGTDGWFARPSFPKVSPASHQMFTLPPLRLCTFLLVPYSRNKSPADIVIQAETRQAPFEWHTSSSSQSGSSCWTLPTTTSAVLATSPSQDPFSRCEMEARATTTPAGGASKGSVWRLVSCRNYPFPLSDQQGCLHRLAAGWPEGLGTAAAPRKGMAVVLWDHANTCMTILNEDGTRIWSIFYHNMQQEVPGYIISFYQLSWYLESISSLVCCLCFFSCI